MINWLLRMIMRVGLRWLILSALGRWLLRRFGRQQVEKATADLEQAVHERLPEPVARVVSALPVEARQVGGSALVAGRAVRSAAVTSRRAAAMAGVASRRVASIPGAGRRIVEEFKSETEASGRRLRSRYLAEMVGPEAATDALLDVRTSPMISTSARVSTVEPVDPVDPVDPHQEVSAAVGRGRRRHRPHSPAAVNRMKRSYRPALKPWD